MKFSIKDITETAMLIALAIILDMPVCKFRIMEAGGSISFTMVPLFILAIRQGPLKSFVGIGIIYALITCLTDNSPIFALPFDYILGYGCICLTGLFRNKILDENNKKLGLITLLLSVIICCLLRFVFACVSSMLFYETNLVGALVYNATYIPLSCLLSLILLAVLHQPILKINNRYPTKSI